MLIVPARIISVYCRALGECGLQPVPHEMWADGPGLLNIPSRAVVLSRSS